MFCLRWSLQRFSFLCIFCCEEFGLLFGRSGKALVDLPAGCVDAVIDTDAPAAGRELLCICHTITPLQRPENALDKSDDAQAEHFFTVEAPDRIVWIDTVQLDPVATIYDLFDESFLAVEQHHSD